jgi:cytochrome c556
MQKKVRAWVAIGVGVGLLAVAVSAHTMKTEDSIMYRQSVMFVIGQHFSQMGAVVKGEQPYSKESFEQNAGLVATLIKLPWDAFMAAGSDKGSKMKPEALVQKDKFMELAKANQAEVAKLAAAAKGGDLNAIKSQFGEAGKTCKACHDAYRNK